MDPDQSQATSRYQEQVDAAKVIAPILNSPEWALLCREMDKHIQRLIQLTEEADFVKQAADNPVVLADNLSFRRGIRYVLDYPTRLIESGNRSAKKLEEIEIT